MLLAVPNLLVLTVTWESHAVSRLIFSTILRNKSLGRVTTEGDRRGALLSSQSLAAPG